MPVSHCPPFYPSRSFRNLLSYLQTNKCTHLVLITIILFKVTVILSSESANFSRKIWVGRVTGTTGIFYLVLALVPEQQRVDMGFVKSPRSHSFIDKCFLRIKLFRQIDLFSKKIKQLPPDPSYR